MVSDLRAKVIAEGRQEAEMYDEFACFCKSKTDEKTEAIGEAETSVSLLTTRITNLQATRDQLDIDIQDLNDQISGFENQVSSSKEMRAKETATFEAGLADVTHAITQMEKAIDSIKAMKPSLAQIKSLARTSLLMADAMDMIPKTKQAHKVVTMLLSDKQPVMDVPVADYTFHAGGIIETLENLLNTFREKRNTLESDNTSAQSAYDLAMQAKNNQVDTAQQNLEAKTKERAETTEDLSTNQADLTETNAVLNDDRLYLKDLTAKCEAKAKLWDQRSQMRADELTALTQALVVLQGSVAAKAEITGDGGRAESSAGAMLVEKKATPSKTVEENTDDDDVDDDEDDAVAFLQKKIRRVSEDPQPEIRKRLISLLKEAGKKLKSPVLSTLAVKVQEDPFAKIKTMIQELIERLLEEQADEATHKGYCDEEIAKTVKDRDYRLRDIDELNSNLEKHNARTAKLTLTKGELEAAIDELTIDYQNQTAARAAEKAEHAATVSETEEGLNAIKQAMNILSHFYGAAAKAFTQQPVADDAPDAGFDANYTGSQGSSTGIIGMMEVIEADFERTIRDTLMDEEQAKRDFVEFERVTLMSNATKHTALEATDKDLAETAVTISDDSEELQTQQALFDTAVKTWEQLLPGCVADPGMSNSERVERREAEVAALKDAYCILSDQEAGCDGVFLQKRARVVHVHV
jgi:DNA repair exonuclease SbcCD ATPase subunit